MESKRAVKQAEPAARSQVLIVSVRTPRIIARIVSRMRGAGNERGVGAMECRDCGLKLDVFGICPQAEPEMARQTCSPIYCGKSLEANSKEALAQAIAALNHMQNRRQPVLSTRMRGTGASR